jgi:hypothetical protein
MGLGMEGTEMVSWLLFPSRLRDLLVADPDPEEVILLRRSKWKKESKTKF